jgi:hypothetical protein
LELASIKMIIKGKQGSNYSSRQIKKMGIKNKYLE